MRGEPPRLARRWLRRLPVARRRPETETDLAELFDARVEAHGPAYARRRYWRDVLSLWNHERSWSDVHTWRWSAREVAQDLIYALRLMRRNPGVVAITTTGLGLAIAVCASVFSLLNAVAFRSNGVDDPASAVHVFRKYQNGIGTSWTVDEYLRLRHASPGVRLEATLTETTTFSTVAGEEDPPSASIGFVTGGYLEMLNRRVTLGRTLTPEDDAPGAPPTVVVSYLMWARRLGADPSIVGRNVWLNGRPATIVGVAARGFTGSRQSAPDAWAPVSTYHSMLGGPPLGVGSSATASVVGRIASGISIAQGEAAVGAVAGGLGLRGSSAEPVTGVAFSAQDNPINRSELRTVQLVSVIISIVIGLVLLLACANVSNLLLASATTRAQEMGVRLAIGASRGRIVRQLLTESVALGAVGGAIGLLLMLWAVPILARLVRAPASIDVTPDARVYLFLSAISILAGLGAGLAPARHALRDRFGAALKESARQAGAGGDSTRLRAGLVGIQAAASIVLVVLAALLVRATIQSTRVDVGFEAGRLLTVSPAFARGSYDAAGARAYWDLALERVRALPGVVSATVSESAPFGQGNRVTSFRRSGGRYTIYFNEINADYFPTVGLRVLRGRTFSSDEVTGHAPVVLISARVARDFFGGEDPLGQSLERVNDDSGAIVIGVVSDAITARLRELGSPSIYEPMRSPQSARMIVRSAAAPEALIPSIRNAIQPLDPRARLTIAPVSEGLRKQLEEPRTLAFLASVVAVIALMLAVVGLYGVTTFVVGQRLTEIGVRMALGATGADVLRLLLRDSLRPVAAGLGAGVLAAMLCTRVFSGILYGLSAADPLAFGAATLLLFVAAAGAVIVPARRAASSDPAAVLRRF